VHPLRSDERAASIQMFLADPPRVHDGAPGGVWGTSTDCYEFMASHLPDNPATLETGLGLSTLMLGTWARRHTCVVGSQAQVDALQAHARNRGYSLTNTRFAVGSSDQVLPSLQLEPIDLFLIDGGHGYPMPVIDWYYGSLALRAGGVVVVDDIQLPSVDDYLVRFLREDPRWLQVAGDGKWVAFRKEGDFSLREEWTEQGFLGAPRKSLSQRLKSGIHRRIAVLGAANPREQG
jgi:hypothetical protein